MAKQKKKDVKEYLELHSLAKLDLLDSYLELYLSVLLRVPFVTEINIFDLICGKAIYKNGKEGSPLRIFKIVQKCLGEVSGKRINIYLNDLDPKRIENVQEELAKHEKHSSCTINLFNRDFQKVCEEVLTSNSISAKQTKNFFFIDPYGYKSIKKDALTKIMKSGNSEILLFLPVSMIYRFKKKAQPDEVEKCFEALKNFIDDFFEKPEEVYRSDGDIHVFINTLKEALSFNNQYYSGAYKIQRDYQNNYFGVFFITANLYGLVKFVEAKWKLDPLGGQEFSKSIGEGQTILFPEEEKKVRLDILENKMKAFLKDVKDNKQMFKFITVMEFKPAHANEIISKWKKQKIIEVLDVNTNQSAKANYIGWNNYNQPPKANFRIKAKSK